MTRQEPAPSRDPAWLVIGIFEGGRDAVRSAVLAWLRDHAAPETTLTDEDMIVHPLCGRDGAGQWVHETRVLIRREAVGLESV
jgi:hypothetical protein